MDSRPLKHVRMVYWDSYARPYPRVKMDTIAPFSARGMRRVHSRADNFPRNATFHMDIWTNRKEELYVRFWQRSEYFKYERDLEDAFTLKGIPPSRYQGPTPKGAPEDWWLPKILRDEYDLWILLMLNFDHRTPQQRERADRRKYAEEIRKAK